MSIDVETLNLATSSELDLGSVKDDTLWEIYSASEFGVHHAEQPLRYTAGFGGYDRPQMLRDLGPDVHPLGHMRATHNMLKALMTAGDITREWSTLDLLAAHATAQLHDIGECTHQTLAIECNGVVGDIHHAHKTPEQRAAEARVRNAIYQRMSLPEDLLARMEGLIWHHEESPVHDALEAAHNLGAYRVGVQAGRVALRHLEENRPTDKRFFCLQDIAQTVPANVQEEVEKDASVFPYIAHVLKITDKIMERASRELM
jgi:hypothetical protein